MQWGHNYSEPWATIGKTTDLQISEGGLKATFELRDPVNDADPQNVIRQLWDEGWIKTASIGFNPNRAAIKENDAGGFDFNDWELLEWSLVPIPANQEALRLAVKGLDKAVARPEPEPAKPNYDVILAQLSAYLIAIKEGLR